MGVDPGSGPGMHRCPFDPTTQPTPTPRRSFYEPFPGIPQFWPHCYHFQSRRNATKTGVIFLNSKTAVIN